MNVSDDKISHLSHLVLRELQRGGVRFIDEESQVLREIKRRIASELKIDDEVDGIVRRKLDSYARRLVEGSSEWSVLYERFYDEEMRKRNRST
jgi:hypothetical protein